MGRIAGYRHILQGLFSKEESATRNTLVELSTAFADAQNQPLIPHPEAINDNHGEYSLYAASKELGIGEMNHMFLRLVDSQGRVVTDIHGLRLPSHDDTPLEAIIEPLDFEYFSKMISHKDILLWTGSAEEAGIKMQQAMALTERVNQKRYPYNLFVQSCNTLFHSYIDTLDLQMPKHLPLWFPGMHQKFEDDIEAVRAMHFENGAEWMDRLNASLEPYSATITQSLAGLRHHAPA